MTETRPTVTNSITLKPCPHGFFEAHPVPGGACYGSSRSESPSPGLITGVPQRQSRVGDGDCLAASLATITGLDVPNLIDSGPTWFADFKVWRQQESVRAGLDPWLAARIAIFVALAFGLGLFVGVRFVAATSRPAPEHVVPASVQGPIGAPLERDAGTASDGGADGGGVPSPVTVFEDTSPGIPGTASWYPARGYVAAAGPALRTGDWRGRLVVVSANGRSVPVTLSDWCACPRRLIDLSDDAFARLAPLSRGLVLVRITPVGPMPTLPLTDAP